MSGPRLTDELATRVLCWRPAPDRYLTSGRRWIARSRFQPLTDIRDAYRLLDAVKSDYSLLTIRGNNVDVEIGLGERVGRAAGENKARTITLAIARLLGIEAEANG